MPARAKAATLASATFCASIPFQVSAPHSPTAKAQVSVFTPAGGKRTANVSRSMVSAKCW